MKRREYPTYDGYVDHQASKFAVLGALDGYDRMFSDALVARLAPSELAGKAVLCLGARTGAEVRAFIAAGAFAVGVDVNPGPQNRYVLWGDFHRLGYLVGTVDVVYTNALDHAYDLGQVAREAHRVLKPHGVFLVEAVRGCSEGGPGLGPYEALAWETIDELVGALERERFACVRRAPFETPWHGEQLRLERLA